MASTDSRPIPIKNTAYRAVFPILDADGDLVTGATGLDSEVSKDQGTFADCTNEATEIATASGMYYLDLTSTEMNADCVAVIVKTSSSGAKTTVLVFYPEETGDINVDVTAFGGTAATTSGGRPEVNASHAGGTAWTSGAITAAVFATDAITAAKVATDLGTEIATAVWASVTRTLTAGTNIALAKGTGVTGFNDLDAAGIRAAVGLAAANLDTALGLLATAANLATVAGYLDTEVAAILAIAQKLDTALELDGAVYRFTVNALEQGPSGGGGVADWTADQRTAIAAILGIPASGTTPDDPTTGILDTIRDAVAAVQADTDNLQTRVPAALVGGRMDASVGAMASNVMTAAAAASDLTTELQSGLATAAELAKVPKSDGTSTWNATALASLQAKATDALNAYDPPTRAEATSDKDAILTAVADVPTNAELATALAAADDAVLAAIASLNNLSSAGAQAAASAALTAYGAVTQAQVATEIADALTVDLVADAVAADGSRPTIAQAVYAIHQFLMERAVAGTTLTVKKPDGSTTLMSFTLNDASAPTSITRS